MKLTKTKLKEIIKEEIEVLKESTESEALTKIGDIVKRKKLMGARGELEKTFGKKNVKSLGGDPPMPPVYYEVTVGKRKIVVVNKRYVDGADLEIGDIAIGYS